MSETKRKINSSLSEETLLKGFELMCTAKAMTELYEANKEITAKYVHATSRGHEAIQLAVSLQLLPQDFLSPRHQPLSLLVRSIVAPQHGLGRFLFPRANQST